MDLKQTCGVLVRLHIFFYVEVDPFGPAQNLVRAVLKAEPSFDEAPWPSLSSEAVDFVKRLLNKDYRKRLTASQALSHPWLANYHDVKIPLDMIIYKLVKAYICSSSLRKVALGALAKSLTVPQLAYLREQFTLLGPNKSGYISLQNFEKAVAKNSTEAMKDSRVLDYAHMMSTLQYRKLDFEEFCAVAISVHQLEGMENWEQHACSAYELFEKDGKKPTMIEELASVVDGKLSQTCHLMALDSCYKSFCKKYEKLEGKQFSADDADYFAFHSPYNKRVQKSFARLVFSDYLWNASSVYEATEEKLAPFSSLTDDERYTSRDLEKASQQVAKPLYDAKVQPTTLVPKQVDNMYTASLYAAFVSLIHNNHSSLVPVNLLIKRSEQTPLKEKKLATRVKESEIAERGNGKKSSGCEEIEGKGM